MKVYFLGTVAALAGFLALTNSINDTTVSAQGLRGRNFAFQDDRGLAAAIKSRTIRTSDGLVEHKTADGGTTVELDGRYQNVILGRLDAYGEPVAACVSDLNEANKFFRRDLETGKAIAGLDLFESEREADAKRHGMSLEEFNFYSRLASDYAAGNVTASPGSATFNIINNDGAGEGLNDPAAAFVVGEGGNAGTTRGAQRLNVFNAAAAVWASFLDSAVPTNVGTQFNSMAPCSSSGGVLGSAGTVNIHFNFTNAEFASTWYHAALANKRSGVDLVPGSPEMQAQFNTDVDSGCLGAGTRFYYGLDNATPAGRINLFVVVLHEIGHGVGFSSFVDGSTGAFFGSPARPDIYSRYMFDATANQYWHLMSNAQRQASAINNNNVYWDGPSVRSASGFLTGGRDAATGRVVLHTPTSFSIGSSISHFGIAASPSLLMEPNINAGLPLTLDLARQVMRDIGWFRDTTNDNIPDTIDNVSPSGASVIAGQNQAISWTNSGGFSRNVTIELSTNGGTTFSPLATDIVNTGSYLWAVPNTPTNQARIRIREAGFASPAGQSSSNFTILAQPSAAPASITGRVMNSSGRALYGAVVTFTSETGVVFAARSNTFGYFRVSGLPTGNSYVVRVASKSVQFTARPIQLSENIDGLQLIADN
ncbi:MAG: carboxypeptidase regulatory-like domain-containing protein [Pyrinomonadaceae bacterium]